MTYREIITFTCDCCGADESEDMNGWVKVIFGKLHDYDEECGNIYAPHRHDADLCPKCVPSFMAVTMAKR